jgi:hypothetical protein
MNKFYDIESRAEDLLHLAMTYLPKEEADALKKLEYNRFPLFERTDFSNKKIEEYLYSIGVDVIPNSVQIMYFVQLPSNTLSIEYNFRQRKTMALTKQLFKMFLKNSVLEEIEDYEWDSMK